MTKEEIKEIVSETIEQLHSRSMLTSYGIKTNKWNIVGIVIIVIQVIAISYFMFF
jgi:TfoX/Sxy family transcriptional regulator of competence genes